MILVQFYQSRKKCDKTHPALLLLLGEDLFLCALALPWSEKLGFICFALLAMVLENSRLVGDLVLLRDLEYKILFVRQNFFTSEDSWKTFLFVGCWLNVK